MLFVAYVLPAAALLLYAAHVVSAHVISSLYPLPWLADGIAVCLMLLWGARTWPAVFLGSIFIWGVMRGDPPITVGVDAVGEALSIVITVQIMRSLRFRRQLDRLSDPLILIAAALAGRVVAGLADVAGTMLWVWLTPESVPIEYLPVVTQPGTRSPAVTPELISLLLRWQLNALAGIALAVPVLLTNPRRLRHALRTRRLRLAIFCLLALGWCAAALELSHVWTAWPLLLAAVMLIAWAAVDLGALVAASCTLVFAFAAAIAFCQGLGPLSSSDTVGSLTATWGFIGLLCCVSPVLTVLLSGRHYHDRRLTALADRYRSLFTANPTPAWVADATSGAILMANAEAVRRYGYSEAEFLGMTIGQLAAEDRHGMELPQAEGTLVAAPLIKHVTHDGRHIDVELVSTPLELEGRPVNLLYAIDMTDQQDLRRRLLATVDRESCRLSQQLHDGLGQVLARLAVDSEALVRRTEHTAALDAPDILRVRQLTDNAQQAESSLYQLTSGVSQIDDPHGDLPDALRRLPHTLPAAARAPVGLVSEGDGDTQPSAPRSTRSQLAVSALIILACWLGGAVSHLLASAHNSHFNYADARLAVPSLVTGAAVCGLLLGGRRQWPAVFLGIALVRFTLIGEPLMTALLMSTLGTGSAWACVALLQRWGFRPALDRWQDPLLLCAAAVLASMPLALAGTGLLTLLVTLGKDLVAPGLGVLFACPAGTGVCFNSALLGAVVRWWFDALAGMVLFVPSVTLVSTVRRALKTSVPELGAWCLCLGAGLLLLLAVTTAKMLLPLLTLGILLVVWAAARFGVAVASLAAAAFAMAAAASFQTRAGVLATQDAATGVIYVWGFVGVLAVISLFLAALLAEHNGRRRKIASVSRRYRDLFQGDPRPLWLHDSRSGEILDANQAAARAYGYPLEEFITLNVAQLLAAGSSPELLATPGDRALGPLAMRHRRKGGETLDVEMWAYGTFVEGRRLSICFAHDVTERNTLRRLLFDRAELESRQLAAELRRALAVPLAELRIVGHKVLLEVGRHGNAVRMRDLLESLMRQARRAAQCCHEIAHRLSPLQANRGDLLAALETLRQQAPDGAALEISISGDTPLKLGQQQSEHVYGLLSEIVSGSTASRAGYAVRVVIASFGHVVRVSVDTELPASWSGPAPSVARHPSVLLRARAMGARLWEFSLGGTRTRVVCDLPL